MSSEEERQKIPGTVLDILRKGSEGIISETPKEGDVVFQNVQNIIIGSNATALRAAQDEAKATGIKSEIISEQITGEARDIGKWLASMAREVKKIMNRKNHAETCLISGGETTVTVKGNGLGGRNMELALSFPIEIEGNFPGMIRAAAIGPKGWNKVITEIIA